MHNTEELKKTANLVRRDVVKMLAAAGSGHSAGALGMADVFVALYFYLLKLDPKNPDWEGRDRLILSNGHICPVWYATLARAGYFDIDELDGLRQLGSRLQGHPAKQFSMTNDQLSISGPLGSTGGRLKDGCENSVKNTKLDNIHNLPGIENASGPLGQGVSQAVGLALGLKMDGKKNEIVCVMGDGEQQEGQVWEAFMMASKYRLSNLTFILDRNSIQIDGYTYDVMPLEPLSDKYRAFGLEVLEIDGHNFDEIIDGFLKSKSMYGKPVVIIAHTIPGKDVEFMKDDFRWHGKVPRVGEVVEALDELSIKGE